MLTVFNSFLNFKLLIFTKIYCKLVFNISLLFLNRKDAEIANLQTRLEDEQNRVYQLSRKIKELQVRNQKFMN